MTRRFTALRRIGAYAASTVRPSRGNDRNEDMLIFEVGEMSNFKWRASRDFE